MTSDVSSQPQRPIRNLPWLKIDENAGSDAKLETLSDRMFRVWHDLLCFANEQGVRGFTRGVISGYDATLLAIEVARARLRDLERSLVALQTLRIIERREDGSLAFLNWEKHQQKPWRGPDGKIVRRYGWLMLWHEARTDAKLKILTDRQFRIWFRLLCRANQPDETGQRGIIREVSPELLAVKVARGSVTDLQSTITALVTLNIVAVGDDGAVTFVHWEKRQARYPSDQPDARRDRQQRRRSAKREQQAPALEPAQQLVTSCHESSRAGHDIERDSESELDLESDLELKKESVLVPAPARELSFFQVECSGKNDEEVLQGEEHMSMFLQFSMGYPQQRIDKRHDFNPAFVMSQRFTVRDWRLRLIALGNYARSDLARKGYSHNPEKFLGYVWQSYLPGFSSSLVKSADATAEQRADAEQQQPAPEVAAIPVDEAPAPVGAAPPDGVGYSPWIGGVMTDFSRELGDLGNVATNVSRALDLRRRWGCPEEEFVALLYQAKDETRKQQSRRPPGANKMMLFFDTLLSAYAKVYARPAPAGLRR